MTPNRRRGFVLLCVATYAHFVAMGIFLAALPLFITRSLGGTRTAVGLAVGAFSVSAVLLRPIVGRGMDLRGRRRFLVGGPLLLAVSSAGLFVANAIPVVVFLRLLQGAAGASFYTAGATVATDMAPPQRRAEYIARFSLFLYGGFATGPALGEFLVGRWGFNAAWGVACAAAGTAALVSSFVPETLGDSDRDREQAVRPAGSAGSAGRAGPAGSSFPAPAAGPVVTTSAPATAATAAGPTTPAPPAPATVPPTPRRLAGFLHPAAFGPGFVIMNAAVGYVAISTFSPLYARHIGMESSGPLYVVFALTVLSVRLFAGRLADVYGRERVGLPALAIGAAAFALLAAQPAPALAYIGVGGFAVAFALLFPALMALTVDGVPEPERGAALGSYTAFFDIGASVGSYAIGALADNFGFGVAFSLPSVLCVVGFASLLRIAARARLATVADGGEAGADRLDEPPFPEPAGS